jgi:cytochrome c551/c552
MKKVYIIVLFYSVFSYSLFANDGELLFNGNCVTCHFVKKAKSAPSMMEVVKRYKDTFATKTDFVKYMTKFVIEPKADSSIMLDKIQKYELMPHLGYEKVVVEEISSYLYDANL